MKFALCASDIAALPQLRKIRKAGGRDALNNTFGECVVAKANEADCLANAEVQTREERGSFNFNVEGSGEVSTLILVVFSTNFAYTFICSKTR